MKTTTVTEAKNELGAALDAALLEPVLVEKPDGKSVVIIATAEYERLTTIEDAYWGARALVAEAGGFGIFSTIASKGQEHK